MNSKMLNLLRTFGLKKKIVLQTISPKTHCDHKSIHDYYCDAEQPFVSKQGSKGLFDKS